MNTISVLTQFYESVISPTMEKLYVKLNPVAGMMIGAQGGTQMISPAGEKFHMTQGGYYQGYSDARLRASETGRSYNHNITSGHVHMETASMRWEADTEMLLTYSDGQSTGRVNVDYMEVLGRRWMDGWKNSHTIDMYEDGTMRLGEVVFVNVATNSIQIKDKQAYLRFPEGMVIDVGLEADFQNGVDANIYRFVVTGYPNQNADEFTIAPAPGYPVTPIATLLPGMVIRRELRRNNSVYSPVVADKTYWSRTVQGLKSNLALTGNLWQLPRTDMYFQPVTIQSSLTTGIIYDDITDLVLRASRVGVDVFDVLLPMEQYDILQKRLVSDIRTTNDFSQRWMNEGLDYREGIAGISFQTGSKVVKVYTDHLLENTYGYSIDPRTWTAYVNANGIVDYGNGEPRVVNFGTPTNNPNLFYNPSSPHTHAIEATFRGQYACLNPRHNCVIEFI